MIIGGIRLPHGLGGSAGGGSTASRKAKCSQEFIDFVFSLGQCKQPGRTPINGQSAQNSLATDRGGRLLAVKMFESGFEPARTSDTQNDKTSTLNTTYHQTCRKEGLYLRKTHSTGQVERIETHPPDPLESPAAGLALTSGKMRCYATRAESVPASPLP